jgi:hypothetical protein
MRNEEDKPDRHPLRRPDSEHPTILLPDILLKDEEGLQVQLPHTVRRGCLYRGLGSHDLMLMAGESILRESHQEGPSTSVAVLIYSSH